jgi:serine/threonine protein kinase
MYKDKDKDNYKKSDINNNMASDNNNDSSNNNKSIMNMITSWILMIWNYLISILFSLKLLHFDNSKISIINDSSNKNSNILGEGAFSTVYKVNDRNGLTKYALKKILIQSIDFENIVKTEIDAFCRFKHPNILTLIDYNINNKEKGNRIAYLLFPLINAGSLRSIINNRIEVGKNGGTWHKIRKFNLYDVLEDFASICSAFNVLHSYNPSYVHQDIKPENILICNDGTPLLTDFGSVRLANVTINTRSDSLKVADEAAQYCTMSYRAPELFDPPRGSSLDSRTDVWGIGCLLFAWWFGYSPVFLSYHYYHIIIIIIIIMMILLLLLIVRMRV